MADYFREYYDQLYSMGSASQDTELIMEASGAVCLKTGMQMTGAGSVEASGAVPAALPQTF